MLYETLLPIPNDEDKVPVNAVNNGTVVILSLRNDEVRFSLGQYIYFKNSETWVELLEKDGDHTVTTYGKVKMSHLMSVKEVEETIRYQLKF